MKVGEEVRIPVDVFASPMVGKLVDIMLEGDTEPSRARVLKVTDTLVTIKIVPDSVKE